MVRSITWHTLSDQVFIKVMAPPEPFSPQAIELVDGIWAEAKGLLHEALFDGPILSLIQSSPSCLTVWPSSYRFALARLQLRELLGTAPVVRPLGVTGLLLCPQGLVLGRRSATLAIAAGLWEPAPAGGLDRPDPAAVVLCELQEELGLAPDRIETIIACGLVEDLDSGIADIVFKLTTKASAAEILAAKFGNGCAEYDELAVVALDDIPDFLARHSNKTLPSLPFMIKAAGLVSK